VLGFGVGAEFIFVEEPWVLNCRSIRLATFTKLLGVLLDFRTRLVDDGLDLAELFVAQTELLGKPRQHAFEEAQPVAAFTVAEPTLISTVRPVAAPPGATGTTPVSGSVLSEYRCWCRKESGRCDGQNDISCSHVYLRVSPLLRLVQS
jgi:hypothetical protein